jgi:hypothetical protein
MQSLPQIAQIPGTGLPPCPQNGTSEGAGQFGLPNPKRVLEIAAIYQQYPGSSEITLRGSGILEFAAALRAEWAKEGA